MFKVTYRVYHFKLIDALSVALYGLIIILMFLRYYFHCCFVILLLSIFFIRSNVRCQQIKGWYIFSFSISFFVAITMYRAKSCIILVRFQITLYTEVPKNWLRQMFSFRSLSLKNWARIYSSARNRKGQCGRSGAVDFDLTLYFWKKSRFDAIFSV